MIVYSIQSIDMLDRLLLNGSYEADIKNSLSADFKFSYLYNSYTWMNNNLKLRKNLHCETPIWLWEKHPSNYFEKEYYENLSDEVLLKLDIPEEFILWSDFDLFHAVINDSSLSSEMDKESSWNLIFDLDQCKIMNESENLCVQGVTNEIKIDWLMEVF